MFHMRRWLCIIVLSLWLTSCATNPLFALSMPDHPLYIIAGQNPVPGYGQSAVTLVDRDAWQSVGTRSFPASFIYQATVDTHGVWFGLAGDIDEDAFTAIHVQPQLNTQRSFSTCMEPLHVHRYQETLLVVCRERGFLGKVQQIDVASGAVLRESDVATEWGDMYVQHSFLWNNELYINGDSLLNTTTNPSELQVYDANTLQLKRKIFLPDVLGISDIVTHEDTLLFLNFSSHYRESLQDTFHDMYLYTPNTDTLTPLPLIARSPIHGVIVGNDLYTVHFCEPFMIEGTQPNVEIHKTNLDTWQHTFWTYPQSEWRYIGDMAVVDGNILLTRYRAHDETDEGIYQLDPETGELSQLLALPGASLIVAPQTQP